MKHLPAIIILMLLLASCKNKEQLELKGAYSMTRQVLNDGTKDSVIDRKQLKIYTDQYFMYASPNVSDSFANFGIGKYTLDNGVVTEYRFYTAEAGEKNDTFSLRLDKTIDGFTEAIDHMPIQGKDYKLNEEYLSAGTDQKSQLDGTWKQVKNIFYRKQQRDSLVNNNPLEYKTFQSGFFIWAITVKDSTASRKTSVFGYGHFEMNGPNKTKETVVNSTFVTGLIGKTYEVEIEFPAKDMYKQTITFANGDRSTEIYQRLK